MAIKDIYVTIIPNFQEHATLQIGEKFQLFREPENQYDKTAVAVKDEAGTIVGHVSAKPDTSLPDTMVSSNLFKRLGNAQLAEAWVTVLETGENTSDDGKTYQVARGHCKFIPKTEENVKTEVFTVRGTKVKNMLLSESLMTIKEAIKNNTPLPAYYARKVQLNGSEIIRLYATPNDEIQTTSRGELQNPSVTFKDELDKQGSVLVQVTGLCNKQGKPLQQNENPDGYFVSFSPNTTIPSEIVEEMKVAVKDGRAKASELKEKIDYMISQGVPSQVIVSVLKQIQNPPVGFEHMVPNPPTRFKQDGVMGELSRVLAYRACGKDIRLIGNKGCGKNTLAETVDWIFGQPQYRLQGNADMDKIDLLGSQTLIDGTMEFKLSEMLQVLMVGGNVVLDEGNTIKPEVADLLHSLTDEARKIEVPGYGLVKMHPNASFTLTMNEDYVGTTRMNEATVDRYVPIQMVQPDSIMKMLRDKVPTATENDLIVCDKIYRMIKQSVSGESGIAELEPDCMTIRGFIDALQTASLLGLKTTLLDNVAKKPQDEYQRIQLIEIIEAQIA